jgi:hypothetical protein
LLRSFVVACDAFLAEVHGPDAVVGLLHSDPLVRQRAAQEPELAVQVERARALDEVDLEVVRVLGIGNVRRICTRRRLPSRSRRRLIERFVRTLVVVDGAEAVEATLLSVAIASRRLAGLGLERAVESFVGTVLLGARRLGA